MRRIWSLAAVGVLAVGVPSAGHAGSDTTRVVVACLVEGHAVFEHPVRLLPEENSVVATGSFDCQASTNGGAPEPLTAALSLGQYHEEPVGLFGCSASVWSGTAVVEFDQPLPGGHTAMLIEFTTISRGPVFWHHGGFRELGRIESGAYVKHIDLHVPSDGMGEYVLQTDTPEACMGDGLTEVGFGGPAAGTLTY